MKRCVASGLSLLNLFYRYGIDRPKRTAKDVQKIRYFPEKNQYRDISFATDTKRN